MSIFDDARRKIAELKDLVNPIVQDTFEEYKSLIISFNADSQMFEKGQDAKGSLIRPAYKPMTIKMKKKKGQPYDRVTLRDTGKFHRELEVIPHATYVEIKSSVEYSKHLIKKYGENILGIQEELLRDFVTKYVRPNLQNQLRERL